MLYTTSNTIDFLEKVFGNGTPSNGGKNLSVVCPFCKITKGKSLTKRKLVIRTDNFLLHCWVCDYKSRNLLHIIKRFYPQYFDEYVNTFLKGKRLITNEEDSFDDVNFITLPENYNLLVHPKDIKKYILKESLAYLKKRGITEEEDLWYWKFGVSTHKDFYKRVIIPSFDSEGELNYFTGRSINDWNPKYRNADVEREDIIFNEINLDFNQELIIVEGPFDLVKCTQNATCLQGSTLDTNYLLFEKIITHKTNIILALDNDAREKMFRMADLFNSYDIKVKYILMPDSEKDIGAGTKEEFKDLIKTAKLYTRQNHLLEKIRSLNARR